MTQQETENKAATTECRPKERVFIIGHNRLQNELLISFIEDETKLPCTIYSDTSLIPPLNVEKDPPTLVLFDCLDLDYDTIWDQVGKSNNSNLSKCLVLLFNVAPDKEFEKEAVSQGMRGIFYDHDPLMKILPKAIKAVCKGELWYSRDTLSKCLLEPRFERRLPSEEAAELTFREREILVKIASGASNKEIADDLIISQHTVKTHIYNIYKKINVPNRLQATLWVAKHL